jgi:hypothetical protein
VGEEVVLMIRFMCSHEKIKDGDLMKYVVFGVVAVVIGLSLMYSTLLLPAGTQTPDQTNATGTELYNPERWLS